MARRSPSRYAAYLQVVGKIECMRDPSWAAALAGLAVLRLVDAWAERAGQLPPRTGTELENDADPIGAAEQAVRLIEPTLPLRRRLDDLVRSITSAEHRETTNVLAQALGYADVVRRDDTWSLAADAYRTVIRNAREPREVALIPRAAYRLGACLRMQGHLDDALAEYAHGRVAARRSGDTEGELRLKIAEAHVFMHRAQYEEADAILLEMLGDTERYGLPRLRARALHDRGVVAFQRGEATRAIALLAQAVHESEDPAARERAVADLAVTMIAIGQHRVARQALHAIHTRASDQALRAMAAIHLLEIASLDGDRRAFESYRRELASTRLSEPHAATYSVIVGKGYRRFGDQPLAHDFAHAVPGSEPVVESAVLALVAYADSQQA